MAGWREALLETARDAARRNRPLPAPVYVNLWLRRRAGGICYQPDVFTDLDDAAADAAQPSLYSYAGTIVVTASGCELLDLSEHGAAVERARRADRAEERRHRRGLGSGAGRGVL